jgi:hypothetical protein
MNCCTALCSIGPRQITGWSGGTSMPIEITFTPCASGGMIFFSAVTSGWPVMPSIWGMLGP